ncbi:MAG: polyprenyl synthetase family protein [Gilvibacter sp.]
MKLVSKYQEAFLAHLNTVANNKGPDSLYEPVRYILSLGGKRLRPILTLITCDFFDHDYHEAMNAAVAVEVFHNFSLIHDDIMDQAPLRRGKPTVHSKWDLNTGILSGDAMLILAYQYFEHYPPEVFRNLAMLFSKTALEVCEGQQLDIDFETRSDVSMSEYIKMIEYKTAVLLGAAMKMGALVAGASADCCNGIYNFGKYLGIAFQLQDDYLDAFGNPETFGKQVGGDILANKKTFLYITALEASDQNAQQQLEQMYRPIKMEPGKKIDAVKEIFKKSGAVTAIQTEIKRYTEMAFTELETVGLPQDKKQALQEFGAELMQRTV